MPLPRTYSNSIDGLPGVGYLLPPVNPGLGRRLMVVEWRADELGKISPGRAVGAALGTR
jgi:hypothetical protein